MAARASRLLDRLNGVNIKFLPPHNKSLRLISGNFPAYRAATTWSRPTTHQQQGASMARNNFARHSHRLAAAVGAILTGYAGVAGAAQWRFDNGTQVIWNTSISVGASWRAQNPSNELYSRVDGQLLGLRDGVGGSNTDSATLNYELGDRFSTPLKLVTDVEVRKGKFGALVRAKAWYDYALEDEEVRLRPPEQRLQRRSRWPEQPHSACCLITLARVPARSSVGSPCALEAPGQRRR